ncbi:MAG: serine protease [Pseudomonadota bacterium]
MFRLFLVLVAWAYGLGVAIPHAATVIDLTDQVAKATPSVVGIMRFDPASSVPAQLVGTGFVVADGRHVVTNAHVVPKAKKKSKNKLSYFAILHQQGTNAQKRVRLKLIDREPTYDLALLSLPDGLPNVAPLRLVETPEPRPAGTAIFSIGFPIGSALGPFPAVSSGIVSAVTPSLSPQMHASQLDPAFVRAPRFPLYQLDMIAYPGQSGSPLIDAGMGRVIGVINATKIKSDKERILSDPSGISYAITAAELRTFLLRNGLVPGR